jgi:tetratricopeptide (TPR) repeat protein
VAAVPGTRAGPVAEFCAGLRQLCQSSGCDLRVLAGELKVSRSQLYAILGGEIKRPPDWGGLVRPLVETCTGGDVQVVAEWRRRHGVLVGVWEELRRRDRQDRGGQPVARGVTCTLPAVTAAFTGRAGQLEQITQVVPGRGGVISIHAVGGMPGVGKTALAVQAGHLMAARFPDRQLFVDLHGHTPGRQPADPARVLATLLAADGVDPRHLPAELEERAALWRDRMAGKQVLLILDNAASSAQIAPLLPGGPDCLVLVTSRRFLGDLPYAVTELPLDTLPPRDAAAMFTRLAPRAATDPAGVAEVVALAGFLPLAVSLLARLFARHRSWTMDDLIAETRQGLLSATVENRTVAAAFELSYQGLDAGRQRFFRFLGLHPGPDTDACAAAALAGVPLGQAATHLDALHSNHLLAEPVPRRYQLHDLIRQYARSLAGRDPEVEREQATGRLLDYYQNAANAAGRHLASHTRTPASLPAAAPAAMPSPTGPDQAQAWMAAERATILACLAYATTHGQHARVVGMTAAISSHLARAGPWPLGITLHTAAATAARHLGDQPGEANALLDLGDMQRLTGDFPAAAKALERALGIFRGLGDRLGEANTLRHLGDVHRLTCDNPAAAEALERALGIFRDLGDQAGEANALGVLGAMRYMTGDYRAAAEGLGQALEIFRGLGDRLGQAAALNVLGAVQRAAGDYRAAAEGLGQALEIFRGLGDRLGEAAALGLLGEVWQAAGDYPAATEVLELALDIAGDLGDRLILANVLSTLGAVRQATGDDHSAARLLEQALGIFRDLGDRLGKAEVLNRTGTMHLARHDPQQARDCHQHALDIARTIGSRLEEARALEGIGKCAQTSHSARTADSPLLEALQIYRHIGAADATRLNAEMASPSHILSHKAPE